MVIIEDMGQKVGLHEIKNEYWKSQGVKVLRFPLPTGDYCLMNDKIQNVLNRKRTRNLDVKKMDFLGCYKVSVDTKQDLAELYSNLVQSHERFRDELILAQNNDIKLYILIENKNNVRKIEDLATWDNPRYFIWQAEVRKVFMRVQRDWYKEENAIKFFENRNIPVPSKSIRKSYLDELKKVGIEDILEYLKNKCVKKYIKEKKLKVRKKPVDNNSLIKTMLKMQEKYGVGFLFCTPEESGKIVIELLRKED